MSCSICLEDFDEAAGFQPFPLDCKHKACKDCLKAFVREELRQGRNPVRCFFYKCSVRISNQKLKKLKIHTPVAKTDSQESNIAVFRDPRTAEEAAADERLLEGYAKSVGAVRCPACRIFVERVSGCETILCLCGKLFCYDCGGKPPSDHKFFCKSTEYGIVSRIILVMLLVAILKLLLHR